MYNTGRGDNMNKKKSIYCTDEQFALIKLFLNLIRSGVSGSFSSSLCDCEVIFHGKETLQDDEKDE